jgi:hypothetical protein
LTTGELKEGKDEQGKQNPRYFLVGTIRFQWMRDQVVITQSPIFHTATTMTGAKRTSAFPY